MRIALDGPSGAGKSTVAKAVAKRLGIVYVDTGALYRSIGLYVQRKGISKDDKENVIACLGEIQLDLKFVDGTQIVLLNGEDVGGFIRTGEISMYASAVSAIPEVRTFLLETQRKIARENSVIMDGRDIGTVIIPDAEVKIFLVASAEARAERRYKELIEKGEECTYEGVLADIKERDNNDSTRAVAPAVPAKDAIFLDNSNLNQEQTIDKVIEIINDKTEVKKKPKKKKRRFYRVVKFLLGKIVGFFLGVRVKNKNKEVFDKPFILCANHTSLLDAIVIVIAMKNQIRYMGKKEIFKIPILNLFIKAMGAFPVDRKKGDVAAIKKTLEILKGGECVGIFPQGTRRPYQNPRDTEIKEGMGMMAARAGVGIVPVYIKNKKGKVKWFHKNTVIIGDYISPEEIAFPELSGREKYKAIADYAFDKVCSIGEEWKDKK
ncbi:MAG: (d)CMP kinase [Clostridia bacterium]|nr:(d)CMP kinase [Clostridia bacterium]